MTNQNQKITLKIIAQKLSLDISTVSKALSDKNDISLKTKDVVKQLAEELGYRPNLLAKGLSQKRSYMLGVLVPNLSLSFYTKVLNGIYKEAEMLGYMPILLINDENPTFERKNLEFFSALPVDGILINITPGNENLKLVKNILGQGIPIVCYDRKIPGLNLSSVTIDDKKASYELTKQLIDAGSKSIVFLGQTKKLSVAEDRFNGYMNALTDSGITLREELIIDCQLNEFDSKIELKKLIESGPKFDGVICMGGLVALGAGGAILEAGLKIPQDVRLAEFGDNDIVSKLGVPFTSVNQSPFEIGRSAVGIILNEIENKEINMKPTHQIIPYKIIKY